MGGRLGQGWGQLWVSAGCVLEVRRGRGRDVAEGVCRLKREFRSEYRTQISSFKMQLKG